MLIAEQHVKNGASAATAFCDQLGKLIVDNGLTKIIETGSLHGTGTTRACVDALKQGEQFHFYSIEVNPDHYKKTVKNIGFVDGFYPINGLSVNRSLIPTDSTYNVPDHIFIDHEDANRDDLYYKEVAFDVMDDALEFALSKFNSHPELVILDSVGNMGWIEFVYLMDRVLRPFYLALDDTCHVKHYNTMEFIRKHSDNFKIVWEVESQYLNPQSGSKFGSAIIYVT